MKTLIDTHQKLISNTSLDFERGYLNTIHWDQRLIGILGQRGVGKTTILLQKVKQDFGNSQKALYASLDNFWFASNTLLQLADDFSKQGGTHLFLDEVHKYPNWSIELKNIYDSYPELSIAFTGSSMLEILNAQADLSRRVVLHKMKGLSFKEFLEFETGQSLKPIALQDILVNHVEIAHTILKDVKPFAHFQKYLEVGYYPFYKEFEDLFQQQLEAVVTMILQVELPLMRGVDIGHVLKIKQLLQIIANAVPFVPNVSQLSKKTNINRNTILKYLHYLNDAGLLANLFRPNKGVSLLQKPEKMYLENSNLFFTLSQSSPNTGSLRESFFFNQVSSLHKVFLPETHDFLIDQVGVFEIGGKNKKVKQPSLADYIAMDGIEYGYGNNIPLWLFGFLY